MANVPVNVIQVFQCSQGYKLCPLGRQIEGGILLSFQTDLFHHRCMLWEKKMVRDLSLELKGEETKMLELKDPGDSALFVRHSFLGIHF